MSNITFAGLKTKPKNYCRKTFLFKTSNRLLELLGCWRNWSDKASETVRVNRPIAWKTSWQSLCDLSPLDCYLWSYFKDKVYANGSATTEQLNKNIRINSTNVQKCDDNFFEKNYHLPKMSRRSFMRYRVVYLIISCAFILEKNSLIRKNRFQ